MDHLPEGHHFHQYQKAVHGDGPVPSEAVIDEHKRAEGGDYRVQPGSPHRGGVAGMEVVFA